MSVQNLQSSKSSSDGVMDSPTDQLKGSHHHPYSHAAKTALNVTLRTGACILIRLITLLRQHQVKVVTVMFTVRSCEHKESHDSWRELQMRQMVWSNACQLHLKVTVQAVSYQAIALLMLYGHLIAALTPCHDVCVKSMHTHNISCT